MQINQQIQNVLTNNVFQDYGVIGLFLNSFLSSTAIPLPTEILTSVLLIGGENHVLVGMALVLGSSTGGVLNYFIEFGGNNLLEKFKKRKDQKRVEQKNKNNKPLEKFGWSAVFFASGFYLWRFDFNICWGKENEIYLVYCLYGCRENFQNYCGGVWIGVDILKRQTKIRLEISYLK
jgi:membrane protein YqaA with SNARE-associated domain